MPADRHVISALDDKLHELRAAIVTYEERLDQARRELAVMTAAMTIFQRDSGRITDTRPATVRNVFRRGEVLAAAPDGLSTRELGWPASEHTDSLMMLRGRNGAG